MVETFFTEKRIKKLIIAVIFVFLFNFTFCHLGNSVVLAANEQKNQGDELREDEVAEEGGGNLFVPIQELLLFVCDSIMSIFQENFVLGDNGNAIIKAQSGEMKSNQGAGHIICGVLLTAASVIVLIIPTVGEEALVGAGWASWLAGGVVFACNALSSVAALGIAAGVYQTYVGVDTFSENIKGEFELPNMWYTPSQIFGNKIPLFNVNFFNPISDSNIPANKYYYIKEYEEHDKKLEYLKKLVKASNKSNYSLVWSNQVSFAEKYWEELQEWDDGNYLNLYPDSSGMANISGNIYEYEDLFDDDVNNFVDVKFWLNRREPCIYMLVRYKAPIWEKAELKLYKYSLNVKELGEVEEKENIIFMQSASKILQPAVAKIYKSLRILAIVAMLTILVYVGIRIVLSSAAKDKAKYKQMLIDWLVAFIMLFVLHYLMAFIISMSEELTNICDESNIESIHLEGLPSDTRIQYKDKWYEIPKEEGKTVTWETNIVGLSRFYAGLVSKKGFTAKGIAHTLMYMVFVIYICIFTFQYLKRLLYLAFLTMIAPLVSITYPLDKLKDGKAQGFSLWLKEYIFNALLQPIHYIIYVVIMGSVMQLVADHPIYALVALGFMVPAENFIRKMFGFDKASTVGMFGGAAGAALLMGGMNKLSSIGKFGGSGGSGGKKEKDSNQSSKIRSIDALPEGPGGITMSPNINNSVGSASGSNISTPSGGSVNGSNTSTSSGRNVSGSNISASSGGSVSASNTSIPSTGNSNAQVNKPKNSVINGFKTVGGHYTRRLGEGLNNLPSIGVRALRRGVTYGLGAATLGAVGLAAGIASGDPTKAFQYTVAAGAVGGSIGKNLGDTTSNLIGLDGAKNAFEAGYFGENYSEIQAARYNRDFKLRASNYETAIKNVGRDGWSEMLADKGIIDEALDYGINDMTTMCNIYKTKQELKRKHPGWSDEKVQDQAFKAYELSRKFGDISTNSKTQENLTKILRLKKYSEADIEDVENELKDLIKTYKKISND